MAARPDIQPTARATSSARTYSGRHSTRAETTISAEKLSTFLEGSPLADYAEHILKSPHWSTIIGICWIEQYHCKRAPYFSPYNFWGIGGSNLHRYKSYEEGIAAISNLLQRYEDRGKDTIEEMNGYYVVPANPNWLNTVIKIKAQVESL